MAKRYEDEDYIELEDILMMLRKSGVPVLTIDARWQTVFDIVKKSSKIEKLEKKVNSVMKSQGRINNDKKDLKKVKQQLMSEIMANMDTEENSRAEKKVRKSKDLIEEINDKLILLEDEQLNIPGRLDEVNAELALQSMEEIFDKYEENSEDILELTQWIEETRIELKKRVLLLETKKEENEVLDKYISAVIDGNIIRAYKKYRDQ